MTTANDQLNPGAARHRAEPIDPKIVKAIAHPVRHAILIALNEHVWSPSELAGQLGEPIGKVAYHVRTLLDLDVIELVREERRRGAIEHYYRATMRPFFTDRQFATLPVQTRRAVLDQDLQRISEDVSAAAASGGFDHPEAHVSWTALDLDQEGFDAVVKLLGDVLDRVLEIHAESAGRQAERGEKERAPLSTELAIMHFERPSQPADAG